MLAVSPWVSLALWVREHTPGGVQEDRGSSFRQPSPAAEGSKVRPGSCPRKKEHTTRCPFTQPRPTHCWRPGRTRTTHWAAGARSRWHTEATGASPDALKSPDGSLWRSVPVRLTARALKTPKFNHSVVVWRSHFSVNRFREIKMWPLTPSGSSMLLQDKNLDWIYFFLRQFVFSVHPSTLIKTRPDYNRFIEEPLLANIKLSHPIKWYMPVRHFTRTK